MKLERLMAITILLLNRKRVQAQELANRLEVSLRTVYRDLETLSMSGIPIVSYSGNEGGFEIMESFRLDRQMLSFDELHALFTALRGLQSTQAMKRHNMDRLLEKVGALVSKAEREHMADTDQVAIDLTPWTSGAASGALYEALHSAVQDKKLIRFAYTDGNGEETERRVEPQMLVLKGYTWYLHGYCLKRDDYRLFRFSRIRDLAILPDTFRRRSLPLAEVNERWEAAWRQESVDLVLRFTGKAVVAAMDQFDPADMERQPDGSLIVRTRHYYKDFESMIGFLLSFQTNLTIIGPARIAEAVRQSALDVAGLYEDEERGGRP
ncbi:helix-turn-helix transcriptional regulator [Paenibacillus arenilitoris]|uniref:YafY family transcriptional regulator n=1 Tax=Paenibacillus arenilitoris TaxID=2772299 RepID=A0A927CQE1_9BACL|nr:YafY family protein [Paenibacillus arenilitoris]MBD2870351.1 YafY family transcriptional regulator [Paenibacillus arenilitoris]